MCKQLGEMCTGICYMSPTIAVVSLSDGFLTSQFIRSNASHSLMLCLVGGKQPFFKHHGFYWGYHGCRLISTWKDFVWESY